MMWINSSWFIWSLWRQIENVDMLIWFQDGSDFKLIVTLGLMLSQNLLINLTSQSSICTLRRETPPSSLVYTFCVFPQAAKCGDFLLNATIFRFCVHLIVMPLSLNRCAVVLPVQSRNRLHCLHKDFNLFYALHSIQIVCQKQCRSNVNTGEPEWRFTRVVEGIL